VQFLAKSDRFKGDLWINWERYIKDNSPFRDVYHRFQDYSFKPIENSNGLYFPSMPATHHGGQINTGNSLVTSLPIMVEELATTLPERWEY